MSDTTISIIGKLIAAVFVGIVAYLAPTIKDWISILSKHIKLKWVDILINSFTKAAEQLLHDDDPDGTLRMDYVKNQLTALGIGLSADVISMIEGAVWEVNNQNKQHVSEKVSNNGNR